MNIKSLTILFTFTLTFLLLISGTGFVYGQKTEVKREYSVNGKLVNEKYYINGKREGLPTGWHKNGQKK